MTAPHLGTSQLVRQPLLKSVAGVPQVAFSTRDGGQGVYSDTSSRGKGGFKFKVESTIALDQIFLTGLMNHCNKPLVGFDRLEIILSRRPGC